MVSEAEVVALASLAALVGALVALVGSLVVRRRVAPSESEVDSSAFAALADVARAIDASPFGLLLLARDGDVVFADALAHRRFGVAFGDSATLRRRLADDLDALRSRLETESAGWVSANLAGGGVSSAAWLDRDSGGIGLLLLDALDELGRADDDDHSARSLLSSVPTAIGEIDSDGALRRANRALCRLCGFPDVNAALGRSLFEAFDSSSASAAKAALDGLASAGDSASRRIAFADGKRSGEFRATRLADGDSAAIHLRDVTEQESLREQFAQSQKMQALGMLAGGVAHDFNNALTAIIGFSDLLLTRFRVGDPEHPDIERIRDSALRAADLVRQLLSFSRHSNLRLEPVEVGDIVREAGRLLAPALGARHRLEIRRSRREAWTRSDAAHLEQALTNLIINARDAMSGSMSGGGRIDVEVDVVDVAAEDAPRLSEQAAGDRDVERGRYVTISVRDEGEGIDEATRRRIFDPFFTTKGIGEGTGLGLSAAYGFIRQSGGFLLCRSTLGEGSEFRILLPELSEDEAKRLLERDAEEISPPRDLSGEGALLLVEDEDAVRVFAQRALESRGYRVLAARGGREALDIARRGDDVIDVIVTDVAMPDLDGPAMVASLRRMGVDAPAIYVSGYAESAFDRLPDEIASEPLTLISKPFSLRALAEAVKDARRGGLTSRSRDG